MLGGVTCSFKREIRPLESYEIWTRLLAWDRKWIYLVSHIVKKGAVLPKGYTLQPDKKLHATDRETADARVQKGETGQLKEHGVIGSPHPAIFATSLAKYVFKEGRITIPPEEVLDFSELLPPRQSSHSKPERSQSPEGEPSAAESAAVGALGLTDIGERREENRIDLAGTACDWDKIEQERVRGMRLAQNMANLDDLYREFSGDISPALGEY